MSNYKLPFLILFAILAGFYFLYDESDQKYLEAESEQTLLEAELSDVKQQTLNRQNQILAMRTGDRVVDNFLSAWEPYLQGAINPGQIGQTLSDLAVQGGLLGTRRPTPLRQDYPMAGDVVPVQIVTFSVNGEFPSVFRWLGQAESAFPLARVESVNLQSRGGAEVELLLALAFPLHVMSSHNP